MSYRDLALRPAPRAHTIGVERRAITLGPSHVVVDAELEGAASTEDLDAIAALIRHRMGVDAVRVGPSVVTGGEAFRTTATGTTTRFRLRYSWPALPTTGWIAAGMLVLGANLLVCLGSEPGLPTMAASRAGLALASALLGGAGALAFSTRRAMRRRRDAELVAALSVLDLVVSLARNQVASGRGLSSGDGA